MGFSELVLTFEYMSQHFDPGDFLVYQLEAGFGLLRVIAVENNGANTIWHVAGYDQFFLDVDSAEAALAGDRLPRPSHPHIALTDRAFESTQVAKLVNVKLHEVDLDAYNQWRADPERIVSDRSVRLMMGLR
jgi:hypothetical protein